MNKLFVIFALVLVACALVAFGSDVQDKEIDAENGNATRIKRGGPLGRSGGVRRIRPTVDMGIYYDDLVKLMDQIESDGPAPAYNNEDVD